MDAEGEFTRTMIASVIASIGGVLTFVFASVVLAIITMESARERGISLILSLPLGIAIIFIVVFPVAVIVTAASGALLELLRKYELVSGRLVPTIIGAFLGGIVVPSIWWLFFGSWGGDGVAIGALVGLVTTWIYLAVSREDRRWVNSLIRWADGREINHSSPSNT